MLATTTKPGKKYASLKRPDIYEALRKRGMSKQRAARISNAQANKDAGTEAGTPLHGPGGLLGVSGLGQSRYKRGRKWGNRHIRTKAQSAQDRAIFAKLGKGGGSGGGGGGSKLWAKNEAGERVPPKGDKKDEITADNAKIDVKAENGRYGKRHTYKVDGLGDNFLTTTHRVDGLRSVSTFHLPPEVRGKGIGQKMLLRALRDGDIARESGNGVSDAYRRVQDSLIRKGKIKIKKDEYDNSIMSLSAKGKTKSYTGRRWGNRRKDKDCTCGVNVATKEQLSPGITRIRGNLCNVHGRYGPCDAGAASAKKPKGKKGRKPAKAKITPEQRLAARQQAQTENRSKVLGGLGIGADGQAALEALRSGQQPDAAAILSGGFEKAGLVERAADGSYRLTASGRAAMNAANAGDQGRAGDVISAARDRLGARQGRQAAAEQRKQEVAARRAVAEEARKKKQEEAAKKRGSSGGSKQTGGRGGADSGAYARQQREAEQQADRERRLTEHQQDRERRLREHEADRARRESERPQRTQQQPARQAPAPPERVSGDRPGIVKPAKKRGKYGRSNVGTRTKDIAMAFKAGDPGDYLVVEDREKPTTWHLQVRRNGKPDHGLMGSAWAALHSGFRGNTYQGPNKQEAIGKLRKLYEREGMPVPAEKSHTDPLGAVDNGESQKYFTVFKSDDGSYRWIMRTTTAYRDRDGEIITIKALETDAARMTATGQYGPLRYWHIGQPNPFDPVAPWGPGVDIGDCDYSIVIGRTSIESGTFKSAVIGRAYAESADDYEASPGFFHPIDQPTPAAEYEEIRRFERSTVPIKYGRASNLFTGMTVKEHAMDTQEYERRMKAFADDMNSKGVPPEVAGAVIAGMEQADKSAQAQGIAYKADDPWQQVIAALKAAVAPVASPMDAEDDPALGGDSGVDEAAEGEPTMDGGDGEYIGDMSPVAFKAMMGEVLAPVLKMQDMLKAMSDMHGELKGMMGSATKSTNGNAAEIAALKARLATLEGDQPAVVSNADVEAALKGAPAAPPDPNAPIVPDDPARPFAAVAARTFPSLYKQNPDGSFGGWNNIQQSNS